MTIMGLVKTRRLAAMQKQQRAKAGMKPPTQRYSQMERRSRKDRKEFMKSLALLLAVLAGSAFARTIVVPTQPVSPYADTEVSTNCVLHRSRIDARTFDVHFQFEGTPTNNLEVAFGRDSNTNGVLDVQEIDTVYGWRGGRYFIENVRAWERIETVAATNALWNPPVAEGDQVGRMSEANEPRSGRKSPGVIDVHLENDAELVPRRFTATCGGEAAFTQLATPPPWLFRSDWTLMKVTLWSRFLNFMGIGEA